MDYIKSQHLKADPRSNESAAIAAQPPRYNRNSTHVIRKILAITAGLGAIFWVFWPHISYLRHLLSFEDTNSFTTESSNGEKQHISFEDIPPSRSLKWHNCFTPPFLCARLTVPMDYHRPLSSKSFTLESPPTVNIALMMLPGINHTMSNGNYSASPLLINPGGPGGSGVGMVFGSGEMIRHIVGDDQDVIGFDPRGIMFSTPVADCFAFPSSEKAKKISTRSPTEEDDDNREGLTDYDRRRADFHRMAWTLTRNSAGIVNSSSSSLRELDYNARVEAKLCQSKDKVFGDNSILRHVDTPNVARDMLSIIDAWHEWKTELAVKAELKKWQLSLNHANVNNKDITKRTKRNVEPAHLRFWGFSYGTLLGATFAAMFPDRVERMVLDGVVDADHYVAPIWEQSIRDVDDILSTFFKYCSKAERECAFWRSDDTPKSIETRYIQVMKIFRRKHGIAVVQVQTNTPAVISYSDVKILLFRALYSPIQAFPLVAEVLNLIETEDEVRLGLALPQPNSVVEFFLFCPPLPRVPIFGSEAQQAIMCSDKRYPLNESIPVLEERFKKMSSISNFSDVWLSLMIGCDGWMIPAKDPPMDWDDHPVHKLKPINTSFPLFFISNTKDPVTPKAAGLIMASKFKNAGFLEQKSEGHCSMSTVSLCTIRKIRAYFSEGRVPPPPKAFNTDEYGYRARTDDEGDWETCERDEEPWKPFDGKYWLSENAANYDAEDAIALADIGTVWKRIQVQAQSWGFFGLDRLQNHKVRLGDANAPEMELF